MSAGYHVERVYLDRETVAGTDERPGWRYSIDEDYPIGYRDFLAFLREIGVRPKDIEWEFAGGFNIANAEIADIFTGEDEDDEEEE